jgi:hypothetical protein
VGVLTRRSAAAAGVVIDEKVRFTPVMLNTGQVSRNSTNSSETHLIHNFLRSHPHMPFQPCVEIDPSASLWEKSEDHSNPALAFIVSLSLFSG